MIPELPKHHRVDRLIRPSEAWQPTEPPATESPSGDRTGPTIDTDHHSGTTMQVPAERLVGLQFLRAALRRQRRVWLGTAAVGLAIGGLFHVVIPLKYTAASTVYVAHASTVAGTVAAQDDLAMLQTSAVANRALAKLHEPGLTASALLGKQPGTLLSENILEIAVSGPSPAVAVRRVDALTSAYLAFRAQQYDLQNRSLVAATTAQVVKLQAEARALSAKIASSSSSSAQLTVLEAQRTAALSQITGLQAAIQDDNLNQLAVTNGSKVLGKGALVPVSKKKVFILDGLTGLAAGLGLGLIVVIMFAMLSDRIRRREDVAAILGSPVAVSLRRIGGRWLRRHRSLVASGAARHPELRVLVAFLRQQLRTDDPRSSLLVVPIGEARVASAALMALADDLAAEGVHAVLVDATDRRTLAHAMHRESGRLPSRAASKRDRAPVQPPTLVAAPLPRDDDGTGDDATDGLRHLETAGSVPVLVLATVDPTVGASHLRRWGREAIVTVSAGHARAHHLAGTAELLEAAGIVVGPAVLLDSDRRDDSVGLPIEKVRATSQRLGAVPLPSVAT